MSEKEQKINHFDVFLWEEALLRSLKNKPNSPKENRPNLSEGPLKTHSHVLSKHVFLIKTVISLKTK